jgi:hypothetical protein
MKVTNTVWHWRWKNHLQILKEAKGEAGYFPWLKEIQATDDFDEIKAILESDRFKKLGTGSFRAVYQPVDDPAHVIKMVHEPDDYKMQMNEDDFNTAKRYPLIFPRAYASSVAT